MRSDESLQGHLEQERDARAYRALYDQVMEALVRHDPIGMAADRPDEYKPEVGTILPRLGEAGSVEGLRRVIHEEVSHWRGAAAAGPEDRYQALAEELWERTRRVRS